MATSPLFLRALPFLLEAAALWARSILICLLFTTYIQLQRR
ncbi:Uncharacterised protein [Vibrio cholerae]|nr:Uncharacterised protein [Vibrio cholerae]CSB75534.1 Uncharacterised protein [Vibrio cholerae]